MAFSKIASDKEVTTKATVVRMAQVPALSASPSVCLLRFAGDSASGDLMGSVFGYCSLSPRPCDLLPYSYIHYLNSLILSILLKLGSIRCLDEPNGEKIAY